MKKNVKMKTRRECKMSVLGTHHHPSNQLSKKEGVSLQKDKRRSMRRLASSSRQGRSERWSILNGWPTSYSSKKANGKWRLCIDFTDVNQACPKDSFPLPRIDLIVMPQPAMNSSVSWMLSPATTRSTWIPTTKKKPHSSRGKEPIAIK